MLLEADLMLTWRLGRMPLKYSSPITSPPSATMRLLNAGSSAARS
jgi:hypothetical protein